MQEKITKKRLAISEIILLITSIIAFSYVLGNSFSFVSAASGGCPSDYSITPIGDPYAYKCDGNNKYSSCKKDTGSIGAGQDACNAPKTHPVYTQCCKEGPSFTIPGILGGVPTVITGELARKILQGVTPTVTGTLPGAIDLGPALGPLPELPADFVPPAAGTKSVKSIVNKLTKEFKSGPLIYATIAVVAIATYTFISTLIKTGDADRALEAALRVGIGAGVGALAGLGITAIIGPAGWLVGGLAILGALFSSWLKREQDREITFTCKPWQAQTGGSNCDLCNNQDFPCTEYQCRSLGTGCELINKETDEPRCIWRDDRDVNPPEIQPWEDALLTGYEYVPLPPIEGTGVEVKYGASDDGCSPAFQPFTFGVELDKEGYCKIEFQRTTDFSEMRYDFGGRNLYMKNHTQQMSFPGVVHLEQAGINLTNDGELEFYVRCEAATNGRAKRDEFIFKFCIDQAPDTTSPEIRSFNWPDGAPIGYFEESAPREVDIEAYVNEPSQCKWSHEDKSYEDMENNLICSDGLRNINSQLSYTCSGKLTGLENNRQNKFFFRCNDAFGNVNIQSKTLTLVGTQPLVISSVEPNETTIKSSSDSIKVTLEVETSAGYKQGEATCYHSNTGTAGSYIIFSDIPSYQHSVNIWLGPGDYDYFIRCIDLAGNSDNKQISFTVETDTSAPIIVRVFRDGANLKIITIEEATCVYDNTDCLYDFDDGIGMTTSDDKVHSTAWDSDKNFYIKCQDEFGNRPAPQSCSMTVRPFEI
jgi:hypothetical protein